MLNKDLNTILLDLDGVILNTEQLVRLLKNNQQNLSWNDFFENLDWTKLLKESTEINDSIKIIKELQKKKKQVKILSKVHTLYEMQAKTIELRSRGIEIPIMFAPPHIKKTQIFIPNNKDVLVDDSKKNIDDWNLNFGKGILFDEKCINNNIVKDGYERVKSLEFLLR